MAESEDGIIATDDFIAVIDGSTSKTNLCLHPGTTNGRYCMTLIKQYISQAARDLSCENFCRGVTAFVRSHYDSNQLTRLAEHPEERATASCAVYSDTRREVWLVGDCQCLVDGALHDNPKPAEAAIARKRAAFARQLLDTNAATMESLRQNDTTRTLITKDLIESMAGQNVEYAVVDGFDIPQDKVRIIAVGESASEIVLASDGYPLLMPTLEASEQALQVQMATDPLNIGRFKATKAFLAGNNSFDDRSYIRFEP